MSEAVIELKDEAAMAAWARELAGALPDTLVVALEGDLGAGKTTLVRSLLRALGYAGAVPSPTYTLVETYDIAGYRIHHLDLYRLADPEELEFIGLRDLLDEASVMFIEWPARGEGALPTVDLTLQLTVSEPGRQLTLIPGSQRGRAVCEGLAVARSAPG